jgi:hypothetical protein
MIRVCLGEDERERPGKVGEKTLFSVFTVFNHFNHSPEKSNRDVQTQTSTPKQDWPKANPQLPSLLIDQHQLLSSNPRSRLERTLSLPGLRL